jgi:hypothetical protein
MGGEDGGARQCLQWVDDGVEEPGSHWLRVWFGQVLEHLHIHPGRDGLAFRSNEQCPEWIAR